MTPEAFCWLYAIGCINTREQRAYQDDEGHLISQGYFSDLRKRVEEGRLPSDDVIRRVFRRPFEILGRDCTLEDMQHYWRVTHQDPREKTPVYLAVTEREITQIGQRTVPRGLGWSVWRINSVSGLPFSDIPVLNIHGLDLKPGILVYMHAGIIAESTGRFPRLA